MTLSEIETTLEALAIRHPNLDITLLTTLLYSSGWDEKTIKEAQVLFAQRKSDNSTAVTKQERMSKGQISDSVPHEIVSDISTVPIVPAVLVATEVVPKEEITFYQPDGSEEGMLHAFRDEDVPKKEEKIKASEEIPKKIEEPVDSTQTTTQNVSVPEHITETIPVVVPEKIVEVLSPKASPNSVVDTPASKMPLVTLQVQPEPVTKEPESLIIHEDIPDTRPGDKVVEIPGNLPLLPFESSPHIWSFSHYKDIFHGGASEKEEIKVITVMPTEKKQQESVYQQLIPEKPLIKKVMLNEEVTIEATPYSREDRSLVFLAGAMLFVIIMILGYMYSNGRL